MRAALLGLACLLVAVAVAGCAAPGPPIEVRQAWSRPTTSKPAGDEAEAAPSGPGVIYLEILNRSGAPDRLVGAESPVCDRIELHETRLEGDRMSMAPVEGGLEIPDGTSVDLRPGGRHLMLFGMRRQLRAGDVYVLHLQFERRGTVDVDVTVHSP